MDTDAEDVEQDEADGDASMDADEKDDSTQGYAF